MNPNNYKVLYITLTVYRKCTPTITEKKDWRKPIFGKREVALYPNKKEVSNQRELKMMIPFHHVWSLKRRTGLLWPLNCKEELSVLYTSQGPAGTVGVFQCRTQVYNSFMIQWHLLMWLNVWCKMFFFCTETNRKIWNSGHICFPTFYSHNSTGCNNGLFQVTGW